MDTLSQSRGIAFGEFVFDPVDRILRRGDEVVGLPPRTCELLGVFIQNVGQVLSKETLMEMVWGDTFVEEGNLTNHISVLRKALGETKNENAFIQTLPRKGYRFVATLKDAIRSVAVLPFQPLRAENADPFFGLAMADALIARLSRVRRVAFRPTSAIRKFVEGGYDPVCAGRELRVNTVLEGWFQQAEGRLRVSVHLVRTMDGNVVWADRYDESDADLQRLQDLVSARIAAALIPELTGEDQPDIGSTPPRHPEAYRLFLKGRFHWYKWIPEGWAKAAEYFQRAIDLDPEFAAAYAGLGDAYGAMGFGAPSRDSYFKGKEATLRAIELDDTLAEAHSTLGMFRFFYEHNQAGALDSIRNAIRLNPNHALIRDNHAIVLSLSGDLAGAIREMERAVELDPVTPYIIGDLGMVHYFARQPEQAAHCLNASLELDPNYVDALSYLVRINEQAGWFDEACAARQRILRALDDSASALALAEAFARGGYPAGLEELLSRIRRQAVSKYVPPMDFAGLLVSLGRKAEALDWLEAAAAEQSVSLPFLRADPHWDILRDEARFQRLLPVLKKS